MTPLTTLLYLGAVAQLGEHHTGSVGVKGSNPFSSTKLIHRAAAETEM